VIGRRVIARALDRVKALDALLSVRSALGSPWLTVLTYHRVADAQRASPFDDGVIDTSPTDLDQHLAFVEEHFDLTSLDELVSHVVKGTKLPKNPVLVTFDDGYLDNHDVALPILKRHGVEAIFFIATQYVDRRELFWWDKINFLIKSSTRSRLDLSYPGPLVLDLEAEGARELAISAALRIVKHSFGLDLNRFMDHLSAATGTHLPSDQERKHADSLLMTWDHVRDLRRQGMAVQSHTVTHRVVQTLEAGDLADELRASKEHLGEILGEPIQALAYPVGVQLKFAPHVRAAVEAAGYSVAFTNGNGVNYKKGFDPLGIARLSPDFAFPDYQFRAMLTVPYFRP
jgi:peptidoglycan/xylan/chitin deacetylase (PgdA/CDA1 family)